MLILRTITSTFIFPAETHYNSEKCSEDDCVNKIPCITCANAIGDLDYSLPEDEYMQAGSKHKELFY